MISRSKGSEPWMGSAAKYIQQPISSDVGAELVKLLAENKYLRRKLEEVCNKNNVLSQIKVHVYINITDFSN